MSFKEVVVNWLHRYFSDEEAVIFLLLLIGLFTGLFFFGSTILPFLIALVFSYLLQGPIAFLRRLKVNEFLATFIVFSLFISFFFLLILWLLPLLWGQLLSLVKELPTMLISTKEWLDYLHEAYPQFITQEQTSTLVNQAVAEIRNLGQLLVSVSISSLFNLVTWLVYLVLIPIFVFFLLKDKRKLINLFLSFMPNKRGLISKIWLDIDAQISNYIRGLASEVLILGSIAWICFKFLGLNYAELLALAVGISVLIPFIGPVISTLPVALVALFQFGLTSDFAIVLCVYAVVQAFDSNVLVPWLFSEAVNLHPVSILLAALFFGGLWGFWGLFFAIPLATMFKAIIQAWPTSFVPEQAQLEATDTKKLEQKS